MLRSLPLTRDFRLAYRLVGIAAFTLFTVFAAQIEIYIGGPVPFTLQVLAVLLSGMVLGARDGAASQIAYLVLIRLNLPAAAGGAGAAALFGPTAGYLIGFVAAAYASGWLTERGNARMWQRWLAGVVGIFVIYVVGVPVLRLTLGVDWATAWAFGGAPFLALDLVKAVIAASLTEGGRALLLRNTLSR